jgi:hypothetical protein
MGLGTRKLIVVGMIECIFLAANILAIAAWLDEQGIPSKADWIRKEFLTGMVITVIGINILELLKSMPG